MDEKIIKSLPKKKLKIYRNSFSIYKDIIYLNNSFHHLTPKEFFKKYKILLFKNKDLKFVFNNIYDQEYYKKILFKKLKNFFNFNEKKIFIFNSKENFEIFLKYLFGEKINISYIDFINFQTGKRLNHHSQNNNYNNSSNNIENIKDIYSNKDIKNIRFLNISYLFGFLPLNFDYFFSMYKNFNFDGLYIDLSSFFGLPYKGIILYLNKIIYDEKLIIPHDIALGIISMISFYEKHGVNKLVNLASRNYYYFYYRIEKVCEKALKNKNIFFEIEPIDSQFSTKNKDYFFKFSSLFIPLKFNDENLLKKLVIKLKENKVYFSNIDNFVIFSPSFYNSLEEIEVIEDVLNDFI
jgi:hypothetical protein